MKPICTHRFNHRDHPTESFRCKKPQGHDSDHVTYINGVRTGWSQSPYRAWFQNEYQHGVLGAFDESLEPKTNVQLTLTDLKTIAYYMAEEEDADPTKVKIDKALKEML